MDVLQLVIRREVHFGERGHGGRAAFARLGIDEHAEDVGRDVEYLLVSIARDSGLCPLPWPRLIRSFLINIRQVTAADGAAYYFGEVVRANTRIERLTDRPPRLRRLIGVCPTCESLAYAAKEDSWIVCKGCNALLNVAQLRTDARRKLEGFHTTQTPSGAARYAAKETGIDVTRDDVNNWIRSGRITAPKLENGYREFPILRLLELAERKTDFKQE
ncbi:hypothetical protein KIH77_08765 [Bifidobacterium sp. 82T24]|uniref:hypothetical protein n=1 Tax=Bifidobacterium pluvialisilvae TaxID=2834436 RepID=UPI001C590075|nr:hypothetical protein [Bifidobacterium pluvialisilvae]MBW3088813.1 hypothetical protein [Bifidobacterium pluvialisilvae]